MCRSCTLPEVAWPVAAWMAERGGPLARRIVISSAGTGVGTGQSMTDEPADLVARHGGDPSGHMARMVTEEVIGMADVVLTATREHRRAVVQLQLTGCIARPPCGRPGGWRWQGDAVAPRHR